MRIAYKSCSLGKEALLLVQQANDILEEYQAQGFVLTLRQLYYQFVARGLISNTLQSYNKIGRIVDEGRLSGLIDWELIEDRTRGLASLSTWNNPSEIVEACANQFRIDIWAAQPFRIEVWVEKEALAGVVEGICNKLRVPYLSCRGYTSQSEMWRAGRRLMNFVEEGKEVLILHFGDHDPSGIDMSRDIQDRLAIFMEGQPLEFIRVALNMNQIEQYKPPANPAKSTDSRFQQYTMKFGEESWELDALEPKVITSLIEKFVKQRIDKKAWEAALETEEYYKGRLEQAAAELRRKR